MNEFDAMSLFVKSNDVFNAADHAFNEWSGLARVSGDAFFIFIFGWKTFYREPGSNLEFDVALRNRSS